MLFGETVRLAMQALWAHKMRSLLTLLGIIIGVSSVIAVVSFVDGLNSYVAERIFNLGYFTWVEQQGVSLDDFERRRSQDYWRELRTLVPTWDAAIEAYNTEIVA